MKRRAPALTGVAAIFLAMFLPSLAAGSEELSWGEQKLLETFTALEDGTMEPAEAEEYCGRYLNAMPHAFIDPMRDLAAGLLNVYWTRSTDRTCAAMVDLNLSGQLSTEELRAAAETDDEVRQAREVGRILRAVYLADRRIQAAQQSGAGAQ